MCCTVRLECGGGLALALAKSLASPPFRTTPGEEQTQSNSFRPEDELSYTSKISASC